MSVHIPLRDTWKCINMVDIKNKELYILTGMETRQLFRRMFVTLKKFKELFYPT